MDVEEAAGFRLGADRKYSDLFWLIGDAVAFGITIDWLIAVLLFATRLGMVLFLTPLMGSVGVPKRIRVLVAFSLAVALVSGMEWPGVKGIHDMSGMLVAFVGELLWGGVLAFGLQAAFAAFMIGGRVVDMQVGFGLASLLDPVSRTQSPLLGSLYQMYAIAWFLAIDGHLAVVEGLVRSVELVPLGVVPTELPMAAMLGVFGMLCSLGVVLFGAAIVCLLLIDVGMGVASRVMPQANVFMLSIPIKAMSGLLLLMMSAVYAQPVMRRIFTEVFKYWDVVLH